MTGCLPSQGHFTSVGDTGFDPVTSSVSVISGTPDGAAVDVSEIRGCTWIIAGRWTD
jgi:hypothetical protein